MIFLNSLFGYLSLLIIIKWCTGSQADLYHVMIYMFLSPTEELGENELFWGQRPLQARFRPFFINPKATYVFCSILTHLDWHYSADSVIAYGVHCRSMDAISKTFCTQKNSHGGISLHLFDFLFVVSGLSKDGFVFYRGFKVARTAFLVHRRWIWM